MTETNFYFFFKKKKKEGVGFFSLDYDVDEENKSINCFGDL
jgi:hypothetical protein